LDQIITSVYNLKTGGILDLGKEYITFLTYKNKLHFLKDDGLYTVDEDLNSNKLLSYDFSSSPDLSFSDPMVFVFQDTIYAEEVPENEVIKIVEIKEM
jgi:hypothetical protein